jgi:hypothetical protein
MITVSDEQLKEIVRISKLGLLDSDECKEAIAMMATELLALREQNATLQSRVDKFHDFNVEIAKQIATLAERLKAARDDAERLAKALEYEQNEGYTCQELSQHEALVAQAAE